MAYSIVIENMPVGILTDEGKTISEFPFVTNPGKIEIVTLVGDDAGQVRTVGPGDKDYIPWVVEEVGYGVIPQR